jgi:hypothetical protein
MGLLDEPGLDRLIAAGCACGGQTLVFRTYVDGVFPFLAGEPVGRATWAYDGEKFVDGVYEVTCSACSSKLFSADVCPRCHAPDGLALATANALAVPLVCADADCGAEEIRYLALVPARVSYDEGGADKARSATEPHDDGFHGLRATCRACGAVAVERTDADACPLCEAPGPLRARPGE